MADQVLYRKYRSADFSQVVGQEHVVQILTNAVASGRVAHAYLFTGPRGVGKTSVARLLARSLNCTSEPKPCNKCANCTAAINSSLDVIEIDAASNRRIEEIRDLREKINLAPTMGRYKVYIIDEVHMLTTEAFNALLKTLEEPPPHAVLILATTEAHKLPDTIISRVQRFSFRAIPAEAIATHLRTIATAEDIKVDAAALALIATAARGGFRDAIGLLDQLASAGTQPISADLVRAHLGWSDPTALADICQAMVDGHTSEVLTKLDALVAAGAQPGQLAGQLVGIWRQALVASAAGTMIDGAVGVLASAWTPAQIASALEALVAVSRSPWPEVSLEATLVRLAAPGNTTATSAAVVSAPARAAAAAQPPQPSIPLAKTSVSDSLQANLWPKALTIIKERHNPLFAIVSSCQFKLEGDQATLTSKFNFHRDRLNEPRNRQIIEEALSRAYGKPVRVVAQTATTSVAARTTTPTADLVSSALEILGGEVVDGEN